MPVVTLTVDALSVARDARNITPVPVTYTAGTDGAWVLDVAACATAVGWNPDRTAVASSSLTGDVVLTFWAEYGEVQHGPTMLVTAQRVGSACGPVDAPGHVPGEVLQALVGN